MTFGSLFAGIGGMDLGLERAGMQCGWQVEIDPFARRVLEKHWPDVRRHDDVRTFPPTEPEDWKVDLICGGFPCQDISNAGHHVGIQGERSGLWFEYRRIIRDLQPRFVLVENVAALLDRGMDQVLGDLATIGFDAEWQVLPAAALGAPHIRERLFIFAHSHREHGRTWGQGRRSRVDEGLSIPKGSVLGPQGRIAAGGYWADEPDVVRLVHGVPAAMDRIRGLGNAVVPQVAEWIGRRIIEHTNH